MKEDEQTLVFVIKQPLVFCVEKTSVEFYEFISVVSIFINVALFLSKYKATTSPDYE